MGRFLLIICLISVSFTQDREMTIVRTDKQIVIDGVEDPEWAMTDFQTDFRQEEPNPLEVASRKTEFKVLYDNENLYIFIKLYQERETVLSQIGKRETGTWDGDNIQIFMDPNLDKTTGYTFGVTPSNKQFDATIRNDNQFDFKWDAIWDSQSKINDDYWTVEMKIPFRVLKFQDKDIQDWGFNVERYLKHKSEWSQWQAFRPETGTRISTIGRLRGFKNLKSKQEIIVRPSFLSVFDSESDYDPTESQLLDLNLRYNINAENSLVAAVKPDFAQIETDQDVINYSDYPTQLSEKRPFFLEGNQIFLTHNSYYYSRRMVKPDLAAKFIGSNDNFKYGISYIKNDGLSTLHSLNDENEDVFSNKSHKEDFLFTRLKYVESNLYEFSYLGQYVNSKYELSGFLHAFDATFRPVEYLQFDLLYGTTDIEDNYAYKNSKETDGNYNTYFNGQYKSDIWNGYYQFDSKSFGFEQNLAGFQRANNKTTHAFGLSHKIRLRNFWLYQVLLNYDGAQESTTDGDVQRYFHEFSQEFKIQTQEFGALSLKTEFEYHHGQVREYKFDDLTTAAKFDDSRGTFIGINNDALRKAVSFSTDRSRMISLSLNYEDDKYKQSDIENFGLGLNYKAFDNLQFNLNLDYVDVSGSLYEAKAIYRTYSLKTEYAPLHNLFFKSYIQFNNQDKDLSNNFVVSYEYTRGNFLYLAYNETGVLYDKKDYTRGTILENYQLRRRTFSLKWSNSFFL